MEIEIITTKKKLSKALVNQMLVTYSIDTLQYASNNDGILGTIYNCHKQFTATALLKGEKDYYLLPLLPYRTFVGSIDNDIQPSIVFSNRKSSSTVTKKFDTEKDVLTFC